MGLEDHSEIPGPHFYSKDGRAFDGELSLEPAKVIVTLPDGSKTFQPWLRLARAGPRVTGYYSADEHPWKPIESVEMESKEDWRAG